MRSTDRRNSKESRRRRSAEMIFHWWNRLRDRPRVLVHYNIVIIISQCSKKTDTGFPPNFSSKLFKFPPIPPFIIYTHGTAAANIHAPPQTFTKFHSPIIKLTETITSIRSKYNSIAGNQYTFNYCSAFSVNGCELTYYPCILGVPSRVEHAGKLEEGGVREVTIVGE